MLGLTRYAKKELSMEMDEDPMEGYELLSLADADRGKIAQETVSEGSDDEGHSTRTKLVEQRPRGGGA